MQRCPDCDFSIPTDAINIAEGFALCSSCGKLSPLSELRLSKKSFEQILSEPPAGCILESDPFRMHATASLRSMVGFVGSLGISLFWNGIVSVFVLIAVAGLYSNLIGPLPEWFPAPMVEGEGQVEMNDQPMGLGITLFLCVFLIPFVLIGSGMIGMMLLFLAGRVQLLVERDRAWVKTGVGPLNWTTRFDPTRVQSVRVVSKKSSEESSRPVIEIQAERLVQFGSHLTADRLEWLRAVAHQKLVVENGTKSMG